MVPVCGVVKIVGVVHTKPLTTQTCGFVGQMPDIVMHGWHEMPTCVGHGVKTDGHAAGIVVGHGWHESIGGRVGHATKSDGGPHGGSVDGHGWHESNGGSDG